MSARYRFLILLLLVGCGESSGAAHHPRPSTAELDAWLSKASDDYSQHREAFQKAMGDLVEDGTCTEADRKEGLGWIRSVTNFPKKPVYFTYCGGMTLKNRIYLDVKTGQVFKDPLDWKAHP